MWANEGTFHLMRRVLQHHHALWRRRLPSLTPVQYAVLLSVHEMPGSDQHTIGEAAAVEPTTMADLAARLERGGLIVRTPAPSDARRRLLTLTPGGRAILEAAHPVVATIRDESLATLDADDAAALRTILGKIAHATHGSRPATSGPEGRIPA